MSFQLFSVFIFLPETFKYKIKFFAIYYYLSRNIIYIEELKKNDFINGVKYDKENYLYIDRKLKGDERKESFLQLILYFFKDNKLND